MMSVVSSQSLVVGAIRASLAISVGSCDFVDRSLFTFDTIH